MLGQGSCASVHLFRHEETQTPLAVKVFSLPSSDQQALEKKVASIQHEASIQEILGESSYQLLIVSHLLQITRVLCKHKSSIKIYSNE